ncbi:MAG: transposase [Candidatus Thiodiazotropha endolucinida]
MAKSGLRKVNRYSESFKATAVKLAHVKGILIKDVAESLDIHPFMLSRWIKEVREGKIVAKGKKVELDSDTVTELRRLRKLEKEHERLKMEHALLKKAIRFCSEQKQTSSASSSRTGKPGRSK